MPLYNYHFCEAYIVGGSLVLEGYYFLLESFKSEKNKYHIISNMSNTFHNVPWGDIKNSLATLFNSKVLNFKGSYLASRAKVLVLLSQCASTMMLRPIIFGLPEEVALVAASNKHSARA